MKSMIIGGIILIVALMAGTYFVAGDAFDSDDYINSLTMLGAVAIITITIFTALKYVNQMKNDTASGELAEDRWDGIGEYKNAIPSGWGLAFIGTIVWAVWYMLVGYPTGGFSQIGQWNEETIEYNSKFSSKWENPTVDTLSAMGESIFLVQCAPCHGVDAEGINGKAQNLTHRMSKDSVEYTINNGANNFAGTYEYSPTGMPAGMASGADVSIIAEYVANGFKGEQPAAYGACMGCHGVDGKGVDKMGPNIKEYDNSLVLAVLANGKKASIGAMPSFKGRLNPTQEKALATYIRTLGE